MKARQVTFIDVDGNPLIMLMQHERIQLSGADSRPELQGGELRALATALYAAYVAPQVKRRLTTGRDRVTEARAKLAAAGGDATVIAALDAALRALVDVDDAMTTAISSTTPLDRHPDPSEQPVNRMYTPVGRRRRNRKGGRAAGGTPTVWGWKLAAPADPDDPFPPLRW